MIGADSAIVAVRSTSSPTFEIIFDGLAFSPLYISGSVMTPISGGYQFSVERLGGWTGAISMFFYGLPLLVSYSWDFLAPVVSSGGGSGGSGAGGAFGTSSTSLPDPLGVGLLRPFRRTSKSDFATASGVPEVLSGIGQLLGTPLGHLPWRGNFGAALDDLRHKNNTDVLGELARVRVEQAIRRYTTRATLKKVTVVRPVPNQLALDVALSIGGKLLTLRVPLTPKG
jgi:phage baseplate assembly protein W